VVVMVIMMEMMCWSDWFVFIRPVLLDVFGQLDFCGNMHGK
jgi:hypothetical protein